VVALKKHFPASFHGALIAPCGMNCALCLAYLREKNRCVGCRGDDDAKPRSCALCTLKTCERRAGSTGDYCFDCDGTYPCARLRRLDHRYRAKYGMSMLNNLGCIRDFGVDEFLKSERQRWTCAGCGGVICVHRENCLFCGHPKEHTLPE